MAVTKYVPRHFAGLRVSDSPEVIFTPGSGSPAPLEEVLTGIVAANSSTSSCELSVHYMHGGNPIYLFAQLLLPPHSTTNLDLYLPLSAGQNVSAVASAFGEISLTVYGLRLEEV